MANHRYNFNGVTQATRKVSRYNAHLYDVRSGIGELGRASGSLRIAFSSQSTSVRNSDAERRRKRDLADALSREVFASLYDEAPELERAAADTDLIQKCHSMIGEMQEFKTLREQVHGDPDLSALATAKLVSAIAGAIPEMQEQEKKQQEQQQQSSSQRRRSRGPQADPDGALRRAMRKAAQDAAEGAAAASNGMNGIKPGLGSAPPMHEHEHTGRMELASKIMGDDRLQKIMRIAGRLQRQSAAKKMVKGQEGSTCLVGVELGDDLMRALPSELAAMRPGSKLRLLTLARFAERRLQQYKMSGEAPLGRGPITVLLDESGSMHGECSEWAAAIALACIGIAGREKRSCTVIGFNSRVRYVVQLDKDGRSWSVYEGAVKKPLGGGTAADIAMHIATSTPSGGTRFDAPLRRAINMEDGVMNERADLILVTDGRAEASLDIQQKIAEARENDGLRVFGMTVGGGSLSRAVRQLCDKTIDLDQAIRNNDKHAKVADALP